MPDLFVLPNSRGFYIDTYYQLHDEVEKVSKLHGYIVKTDELPQLDTTLVSDIINEILNSNLLESQQRDQISEALRIDLTTRLQHYDVTYHIMREDLKDIKWIHLREDHFR